MQGYILALDSGTTSSRAFLISHDGKVHATAQQEFPQHYPQRGWVEHDPQDIWSSQLSCISEVIAKAPAHQIVAIGIANQRETTIVWERKTGKPLMRAIVWQDRRTTEMCKNLKKDGLEPLIHEKTGLILDPYFSATKLHWILKSVPNGFERAKKGELAAGTVDTWLLWNLSGGKCHMTDVTNASRTLLFNIHTLDWDDELLSIFSIPREILPEVKNSSDHFGVANILGSIPITGVAGDQQAA
ncbi:MAG: glycerol kinase, partial [Parachlamydia sp.]|nr:glycerol kinase [Parachlamydia sp.]